MQKKYDKNHTFVEYIPIIYLLFSAIANKRLIK